MTPDELAHYREHGYVVVRRLFVDDEMARWRDRLAALIRGDVEPAKGMVLMRDVMVVKGAVTPGSPSEAIAKIQDFDDDAVLSTYTLHPELLAHVKQITGEHIVSIHNMLINKPPSGSIQFDAR